MASNRSTKFPSGLEGIISEAEWNAVREEHDHVPYKDAAIQLFIAGYLGRAFAEGELMPLDLRIAIGEGLLSFLDREMVAELRRRKKKARKATSPR